MNSRTVLGSKPSAAIRARISASWLSMVLASACCSEETRAYRATCTAFRGLSFLCDDLADWSEESGRTPTQRQDVCVAPGREPRRPLEAERVASDVAQT